MYQSCRDKNYNNDNFLNNLRLQNLIASDNSRILSNFYNYDIIEGKNIVVIKTYLLFSLYIEYKHVDSISVVVKF